MTDLTLEQRKQLFAPLNALFDKIFILTLPEAKARQESFSQALEGLDYEVFYGVHKKNVSLDAAIKEGVYDDETHRKTKRTSRGMREAEIACALSHRNMWQEAVDNNYQRILIFEDDVLPCFDRLAHFSEEIKQLPENWGFLALGYYDEVRPSLSACIKTTIYESFHHLHIANWHQLSIEHIRHQALRERSKDFYGIGKFSGAHAYALNLDTAKRYVDFNTPVIVQSDRVFLANQLVSPVDGYVVKDPYFTLSELCKVSSIQIR